MTIAIDQKTENMFVVINIKLYIFVSQFVGVKWNRKNHYILLKSRLLKYIKYAVHVEFVCKS